MKRQIYLGVCSSLAFGLVSGAMALRANAQVQLVGSLNGTNGSDPISGVVLSGSTLYGTASAGGSGSGGVVFSVPVGGGTPQALASFTYGSTTTGYGPLGGVVVSGSTLYGTNDDGGASNDGTVYSVPTSGGSPTILATFNGGDGAAPGVGSLLLSGSTLYGTTSGGFSYNGNVYSLSTSGGTPNPLATFNGTSNGYQPLAGLVASADGSTFYGTTTSGGANGYGEVFSVPAAGGTPQVLASFTNFDGSDPNTTLTLVGHTLYGTTTYGAAGTSGYSYGEVFSVPDTGGAPTVLANFNGTDGDEPSGTLAVSADGTTLYGVTTIGFGTNNAYGEIYSLPVGGGTPTILATFNSSNGEPEGGLILSGDTLYGTSSTGGPDGDGAVFSFVLPEPTSLSMGAFALALLGRRRPRASH